MMPNKYCQTLVELRNKPAHELERVGNQWKTSDLSSRGINALFGPLVLSLFADDDNTKYPAWYTTEDNASMQEWFERLAELGGAGYGSPPYSRSQYHGKQAITGMTHTMKYAAVQRKKGSRYVFLVKATPNETRWLEDADRIMLIRRRTGFDLSVWFIPADEK